MSTRLPRVAALSLLLGALLSGCYQLPPARSGSLDEAQVAVAHPQPAGAPATPPAAAAQVSAGGFLETFDGEPGNPQPWSGAGWDVIVHSRDIDTWDELESMQAMHGADCAPPPATHPVTRYEDAVFACRNHLMTAISAEGYGVIYLTPGYMVDFTQGEASISWDMSTLRTSGRDWVDVWITPYDQNLVLPFEDGEVDLSGPPADSVQIRMDFGENTFKATIYQGFQGTAVEGGWGSAYDQVLSPDAGRRDTFQILISNRHLKMGMPAYDLWWINTPIEDLGWDRGVVQFGHHSYNPMKDCDGPCSPNTWHWDNIAIEPALAFSIIKSDQRYLDSQTAPVVRLEQPAPANAHLRFAGIGDQLEVSFDGGASWQAAQLQRQDTSFFKDEHFRSYWMPIPAGTQQIHFRGEDWWGAAWRVHNIAVWAVS